MRIRGADLVSTPGANTVRLYTCKESCEHMRAIVLGGAACGKSEYAEALAVQLPVPRFYIATMMPFDREDILRIEKHRAMRADKGFYTMERYTDLKGLVLPERGTVLLECLGNLTANELFSPGGAGSTSFGAGNAVFDTIMEGIDRLEAQCDNLVVVSNDVFCDGNAYTEETLRYMETLAAINRTLARRYERTIELVCGIPLTHKGARI